MLTKTVEIDGKQVIFRASAAVPRDYRIRYRRDILCDIQKLQKAYIENQVEDKEFTAIDLEIFENVAYIMAKHADPTVANDVDEWLEDFNVFSIYLIMPTIIELWGLNVDNLAQSKKNLTRVSGS